MKRVISAILPIWMSFNLLIIASIGYGRSRSVPESFTAPHIGLCNNLPCVQDVVPGFTAWDEVVSRFASVQDSKETSDSITLGAGGLIQTTFNADGRADKVDTISVSFAVPYVTLGTLSTQYGVPCKVRVYSSGGVQVIYPRLIANLDISVNAPTDDLRFASNVEITELDFAAEPNVCGLQESDPANLYHDEQWHGFTALTDN